MAYYVTKKRLKLFIEQNKHKFKDNEEFKEETKKVIKDLNEYPDGAKNQLRFYNKLLPLLQ